MTQNYHLDNCRLVMCAWLCQLLPTFSNMTARPLVLSIRVYQLLPTWSSMLIRRFVFIVKTVMVIDCSFEQITCVQFPIVNEVISIAAKVKCITALRFTLPTRRCQLHTCLKRLPKLLQSKKIHDPYQQENLNIFFHSTHTSLPFKKDMLIWKLN